MKTFRYNSSSPFVDCSAAIRWITFADLGWKGKKDRFLLPDASRKGYDALLTNDGAQLDSAEETRAIRDSGMHHIRYRHDTRRGIDGLALALAAIMAAIRPVVRELDDAHGQLLVEIQAIQPTKLTFRTSRRQYAPPS